MSETTGELPVGGNERRMVLHAGDGTTQDITEFLLHVEDPEAAAFNEARVLLDFAAMHNGDARVMEYEDIIHGIPPCQVIFRKDKDTGKLFASFATSAGEGPVPEFAIDPIAGAMTLGDHSVWESGPARIKEGFYLITQADYGDGVYGSLRLGPFVDPWNELQLGIHGLAATRS